MAHPCTLYGLGVQSNVALAALADLPLASEVDVRISLGVMPAQGDRQAWHEYYASPEKNEQGVHHVRVSRSSPPDLFRVDYEDGTRIFVDGSGSNIWALDAEGATTEDTATYLLGPTLGFVLRLRGVTCLHASLVAIDDRAIVLAGPSGFGKSSLAAAFAKRGFPVLGDDVAALVDRGDRFAACAAYPRIRLWPGSVEALFGTPEALPRITPTWDKRFLALDGGRFRFESRTLDVGAIYLLADRDAAAAGPRIEALGGHEALMGLVGNTYTNYLLDKSMRARELDELSRLAASTRIRRAVPAVEFARIGELCDAIEADLDV